MGRVEALPSHERVVPAALLTGGQSPASLEVPPFVVRYDRRLQQLARLHRRLRVAPLVAVPPDDLPLPFEIAPAVLFQTGFGEFSFEALYERTRKYAAFVLHHTYQVNAAEVDDGLQAGYLRLWQRLQQNPKLLEDKTLAWIGKGLIFTALHATRGDWQFRQHTAADGERQLESGSSGLKPTFRAHSRETRQVDRRLDLQRAIGVVAEQILLQAPGKRADHELWALYGLTMLQVSASELSRLFGVREQSIQQAYQRVRERLQAALPHYAPMGATTPSRKRGREALPREDVKAIRAANGDVPSEIYEAVSALIAATNADTRWQDEAALAGIRQGIAAQTQARAFGFPTWRMQRAYDRVHLMLAAQRDPTVRMRRPERRVKPVFTLTDTTATAIHQLALAFLEQPKSYEKLVALHAHINNLAISTTAKHFNIPTSTLRFYAQQVGTHLGTPTVPAR